MVIRIRAIGMCKFLLLTLFTIVPVFAEPAQEIVHPERIIQCLKNKNTSALSVLTYINPYYLRGDFNGNGNPDYAIRVRSNKGGRGVLICSDSGKVFLLGMGIGGGQFSDMPEDNFLAPHWEVITKREVVDLKAFQNNVPKPVPSTKGEAIAMIWEDGISLIYWDGTAFKWAGSKE